RARARLPHGGGGVAMTPAQVRAEVRPGTFARPLFRGPLAGQRPRVAGLLGGDTWLVLAIASLVGLGTVMVFNVSYFYGDERFGDGLLFFRKHVASVLIGVVAAMVAARLPTTAYRRAAYPVLFGVLVGLVLVLIPGVGVARSGARRWIQLGPLGLQPSELAKFAAVLYLASSLTRKSGLLSSFTRGVLPHCLVLGLMAGLI